MLRVWICSSKIQQLLRDGTKIKSRLCITLWECKDINLVFNHKNLIANLKFPLVQSHRLLLLLLVSHFSNLKVNLHVLCQLLHLAQKRSSISQLLPMQPRRCHNHILLFNHTQAHRHQNLRGLHCLQLKCTDLPSLNQARVSSSLMNHHQLMQLPHCHNRILLCCQFLVIHLAARSLLILIGSQLLKSNTNILTRINIFIMRTHT